MEFAFLGLISMEHCRWPTQVSPWLVAEIVAIADGLGRNFLDRQQSHLLSICADPACHWSTEREVHAYILGIETSPMSVLLAELHLAIEDAVLVVRARKFQSE